MARKALRAVPRRKLTVTEAADRGSVREQLAALRERIATAVEDAECPARDLAALSRRLIELTREIAVIDERVALEAEEQDAGTPGTAWEAI